MGRRILYFGERLDAIGPLMSGPDDVESVVCYAQEPTTAVARLREAPFDCLFCEASMEGLNGFLRGLQDSAPDLPVVIWQTAEGDMTVPAEVYDHVISGTSGELTDAVMTDILDVMGSDMDTDVMAAMPNSDPLDGSITDTGLHGELPPTPAEVNIAERGFPEDDLWTRQEFFDSVLNNLLDVFFVHNSSQELVAWNKRLEEVTGYTSAELAGRNARTLIAEEDRAEAYEKFAEILTAGHATAEFHIVDAEGERIPYEFKGSLITDDEGTPRYICGIGRDVSELRRKEAELERKQAELNEAIEELRRSNAELEQFAYVASHDMKEPLRMISSYLQLLERRYGDELEGEAHEFIEFAVNGAERMRRMIDQLLTFSRIDRRGGSFRAVNCEEVIDTVCRNLKMAIEENNAEITVGNLPTVTGDRDQLVQLFQNLVSNAIRYAGDEPPKVEITATRRGEMWEFAVSDEGVGIPEDRIDRVFDIFYTDSDDDDSTGIGLAIARKIVERHDGEIEVESTVGEGTTFRFTLPDKSVSLDESPADRLSQ